MGIFMHNPESMNADAFNARSRAAKKSTQVSIAVNILLSLLQITVGLLSGSQGLIADGIHSISDLVADFVVMIANIKSRNRRTAITTTDAGVMRMVHR